MSAPFGQNIEKYSQGQGDQTLPFMQPIVCIQITEYSRVDFTFKYFCLSYCMDDECSSEPDCIESGADFGDLFGQRVQS